MLFQIEDAEHAEVQGTFETLDGAITELKRRAIIPWSKPPNIAPCQSWKTCCRSYEIIEYDDTSVPWNQMRIHGGLEISSDLVKWTLANGHS